VYLDIFYLPHGKEHSPSPFSFLEYDGFLAGRPSNTFPMAFKKVLEGFVKKGALWH
jgi:hypothetical protein